MTHGVVGLLLTAAVGYWVLERASDQKKGLKTVGQIVGAVILVISFMGVACKLYSISKRGAMGGGYGCPIKFGCPFKSEAQKPAK